MFVVVLFHLFKGTVTSTRVPQKSTVVTTPIATQSVSSNDFGKKSISSEESSSSSSVVSEVPKSPKGYSKEAVKRQKIEHMLVAHDADLAELRKLCWSGIPIDLRPVVWKLLLGVMPTSMDRRETTLARKRQEYVDLIPEYEKTERAEHEAVQLRQIQRDIPRPHFQHPVFQMEKVQETLTR